MARARRLVQLLIVALILSLAGGTAMAELGCVSPMAAEAPPMPADCPDATGDDAALSCQPMCLAIQEAPVVVAEPLHPVRDRLALVPEHLPTRHIGPEPPPPRAG
jgi:hypothetical protein